MTTLDHLIAPIESVLLDFDGPICSVFAGRPASDVAGRMLEFLAAMDVKDVDEIDEEQDPLEVLRWTDATYPALTKRIEDILCVEEERAVSTASPTPSSREAIFTARRSRRSVAIVSNNSPDAIRIYLDRHQLTPLVTAIVGRTYGRPSEMKPNPANIYKAMRRIDARPQSSILIGDSTTDMKAAKHAGIRAVGYVKSQDRKASLLAAGADALIENMGELVNALGKHVKH